MNKMRFDAKCVKECLAKKKIVYTVRTWEGYTALSNVEVEGIGPCTKKRLLRVIGKEDLTKYLSLSGFGSLDDWWSKIRSFGACSGWLFEVKVMPVCSYSVPESSL